MKHFQCSESKLWLFLFLLICVGVCSSQPLKSQMNKRGGQSHQYFERYQIIESPISAQGTYLLDTFEGTVWENVVDSTGDEGWQRIEWLRGTGDERMYGDREVRGEPNYSLFTSTHAMKYTYLLNTRTGLTWQLFQDKDTQRLYFSVIKFF